MAKGINNFLSSFVKFEKISEKNSAKVKEIKSNKELAQSYTKFGKISVILFMLAMFFGLGEFLIIRYVTFRLLSIAFGTPLYLFGNIFFIFLAYLSMMIPIYLNGWARKYAKMQHQVNEKPIGKIMKVLCGIGYAIILLSIVVTLIVIVPVMIAESAN